MEQRTTACFRTSEKFINSRLQFFGPKKEITFSVDTSQNGLGAVLQVQDNKPCAFASRSMTDTQQRYA
jgi:hypothetical protein